MRNGRGLAVCVAIVVTLTACNGEAARHSDESSPSDTVDGSLEPGRERTGTVTIEISAPAGESPGELASLLASLLAEEYPGALSATVSDRGNIIVVVEDISEPEAADLERLLDGPELASMRAVRSLEDCDAEPDVEPLGASDGTTLCVALLGVSNPFERGSTSIGESSLSVTIRPEKRDEVNELFTQCFEAESSCPAIEPGTPVGRVAVVFDSTVVFAAAANIPEVDSRISLSGPYTRDELTDLAATLNSGSIERFDVVDATWDPDS